MSIWTKIKLYAEKKEREHWLETRYSDQKCPHCETWQGNCGGWKGIQPNEPDEMHDKLQCGKCGQWSTWFAGAPVLILVDPKPASEVGA
jgi:hypothetical protein